jgi:hypothetical protein
MSETRDEGRSLERRNDAFALPAAGTFGKWLQKMKKTCRSRHFISPGRKNKPPARFSSGRRFFVV